MPYNELGNLDTFDLSSYGSCPNICCILTLDNIVQLMGNITITNYPANAVLLTLPNTYRPQNPIILPIIADISNDSQTLDRQVIAIKILPSGNVTLSIDIESGMIYTNGFNFNVNDTYYNNTIGNNFQQGTSMNWEETTPEEEGTITDPDPDPPAEDEESETTEG